MSAAVVGVNYLIDQISKTKEARLRAEKARGARLRRRERIDAACYRLGQRVKRWRSSDRHLL